MLKREIADVRAVETANEHVKSSKVSVLELLDFMVLTLRAEALRSS